MNNVLYEDNHIIVVEKKINIPVQEDDSKDKDLLTIIKEYLKLKTPSKKLLASLINKIEIDEDKNVNIYYLNNI